MEHWKAKAGIVGAALCIAALLLASPRLMQSAALIDAADDPARLADVQIEARLRDDPGVLAREIETALAANDSDLARSFVEIADAKAVWLEAALRNRVEEAVADAASAGAYARGFASGLWSGEAADGASLAGTVAGDLFVFGDIRDAAREGFKLARGEDADTLILGLAGAGLALTAATYASVGTAAPVRAGLTLVKDARKVGRLGEGLTRWASRSAREVVDTPALRKAISEASVTRPAEAAGVVRAAFRTDKAGGLFRVAKDTGRIGEKLGTRGALDVLKIADGPADVARAARLAEKKGGQTRAILKMFGRGALLLTLAAFNVSWWLLWAAIGAIGFIASIKATTERLTQTALDRARSRRLRRMEEHALAPRLAAVTAGG